MELLSQSARRRHGVPTGEEALEQHVTATTAFLDSIDDIFCVCTKTGGIERWNERLPAVTGYTEEALASTTIQECVGTADRRLVEQALTEAIEAGTARWEANLPSATETTRRVEFTTTACTGPGDRTRLVCVGRTRSTDETGPAERTDGDNSDCEHDRQYRRMTERISDGFYALDDDWQITYWNDEIADRQDLPEEAAVGAQFFDLFPEVRGTVVEAEYRHAMQTQESTSFEYYYEPLEYWTHVRVYPSEGGISIYSTDISERKERELALERAQDRREQAEQLANLGAWEIDVTERPYDVWWSDEVARIHGFSVETDHTLDDALERYRPADQSRIREAIDRATETAEGFDIETRLVTDDGEQRWVRSVGEPITEDGKTVAIRGSIQDITRRTERERELQRSRDLLRHTEQLARTGGWEADSKTSQQRWTDGTYAIHDLDPDSSRELTVEDGLSFYHPADRDEIERAVTDCLTDGEPFEQDLRLVTAEDRLRWVRASGEPIESNGERDWIRGAIQDITARKQREIDLESLHEATQGLLGTETETEVAGLVGEVAEDVLDVAAAGVYRLDDDSGQLDPIAVTEAYAAFTDGASAVPIGDGDSALSTAFLSGAVCLPSETASWTESWIDDDTAGVLVPIGEHGVFVAVAEDDLDTWTRRLVETLVATTEAALDRLESEAALSERDAELETRNKRLRRQVQVNELIRSLYQSLRQASTRDAITDAACDRLAEADWIEFAWIGVLDARETTLDPLAWSGTNPTYLDTSTFEGQGSCPEPAWQTATTGDCTVVDSVLDGVQADGWRKHALASGYQSVLSVPLSYDKNSYGVLTVYAGTTDAFGDLEQDVFEELGEHIASAITTAETRQALQTDTALEVGLHFADSEDVLQRIAGATDCEVTYETLVTASTDQSRLFFDVSGADTAAVTATLDELHAIEEHTLVSDRTDSQLFAVTVTSPCLVDRLVRHGGQPQSIVATPGETTVTVDLPHVTDVRSYVEMLADTYGSVELTARRTVERELQTRQGYVSTLLDSLTERQREVLRTAYFGGFFEWPRESTGEQIADLLGVSQPTVNRHLRLGQQTVLAALFD
jgi:PAS domain S-box-containing protein